jgi:protein TonB
MNNVYAMSATLEARKNSQAAMITAGFAAFMVLLMILWKWKLPVFEIPIVETAIEVELNLPDEPQIFAGGGGGGGNPVQAIGDPGTASAPPIPGDEEEAKDFEEDNDVTAPPVVKPVVNKPTATKINNNTSTVKAPPKPVLQPPAPAKPKAQLGKYTGGNNTGGGAAENYDRSGGNSNGTSGVGNGTGSRGGTGTGTGGGNGPGIGTGNGPSRVSGSRRILSPKPMNAGENIEGRIRAKISVSPDGVGTFISGVGGSLMSNRQAIEIVKDWLRRNRFNASSSTTEEVYDFNIKMGG